MNPRRSAILAALLVVLAVIASYVATEHTKAGSNVEALLGEQGTAGADQVEKAPGYGPLPSLAPAAAWDNSAPLTDASLMGKVVLIDFWTASCINCRRTFPFLRKLQATYASEGLVIIGVHSPEFNFEKSHAYVTRSIQELDVTWPVAEDPNMAIWNEFSNEYWPANYLADRNGDVRYTHFGEGDEEQIEGAIRLLLSEGGSAGSTVVGNVPESQQPATGSQQITAETYLGTAHGVTIAPTVTFSSAVTRQPDWATIPDNASATLNYQAKDVYALMGPASTATVTVDVTLNGKQIPAAARGPDIHLTASGQTVIDVTQQDLYHVLTGTAIGSGTLVFTPLNGSVLGYTFTFGA